MSKKYQDANGRGQRDGSYDRKFESDFGGMMFNALFGCAYKPPRDEREKRAYSKGYDNARYPKRNS
jgi:hypothetical protein